jgi:hypothetical protein
VERAAFDLHGKLERLNTSTISPASRFEILELLQSPFGYILDSLKKDCSEGVIPLNTRRRMIADLRLDILIQVVRSYKTVLSQLHETTVTGVIFRRQIKQEALRYAINYLGEVLLHSYVTYHPCISYVWKELHGIYYYAVQNGLVGEIDIEVGQRKTDQLDIDGLYKQILLLALANPKSMLRGEAERVNTLLKELIAYVDLKPIWMEVDAGSYYIIDAQSDDMPCAPNLQKDGKINIGWYLVTDNLGKVLDKKVAAAEKSQNSMRPSDAGAFRLLNKLRDAWLNQIRSRELRNPASDMVELICGLDDIYQVHGGAEPLDTASWQYHLNATLSSPGHHTIGSPILDNDEVMIEVEPGTLELYRPNKRLAYHHPIKEKIKVNGKECIATNMSENGCCLNWPNSGNGGTHVGELVGINPKSSSGDIIGTSLGVVRWLYADQPGFLGMGVELFGGLFEPVILQCKHERKHRIDAIKAFLQHTNGGDSVSLIAPPFYIEKDDQITVITGRKDILVDITSIIESTDSFVRFQFEQALDVSLVS